MSAKFKFAVKTALSLTLAYLLPMAWGWSQPQTAAITVMLIAATGSLSESLQKGVLRTFGTVAGATIGLTLIALFPQDRLLYLACLSVFVTLALYLYNAYQGDSTVFMLTIVVALMVFNGGDADGAFIYGIDRTLLTIFGVLTYSLVGSFLWPVKIASDMQRLASAVTNTYARVGSLLSQAGKAENQQAEETEALENILESLEEFRSHYIAVRHDADEVQAYQSEWNAILSCYQRLEAILVPTLRSTATETPNFDLYIDNHSQVMANVEAMLNSLQACWVEDTTPPPVSPLAASYNNDLLKGEQQLTIAAVINRAELLNELQDLLLQLFGAVCSLRFDSGSFRTDMEVHGTPSFIWFDRENLKTALRGFFTFWLATFIWIQYNPPGGFMFVTMCTALVPLVSYTPVTPKLLIILFSLGFAFALPAYVFLLPELTHWLQLALFLFVYAFIGFFILPGPVAIFFLMGLFTLGIQNTMNYNFDVILLIMLMFYMVCAFLIISVHFPFTSKPQSLYPDFRRRFLVTCAKILRSGPPKTTLDRAINSIQMTEASALLGKMQQWGPQIDSNYFPGSSAASITAFNHSCENLLGRLRALTGAMNPYAGNRVIDEARKGRQIGLTASLCDTLACTDNPQIIEREFDPLRDELRQFEEQLRTFLDQDVRGVAIAKQAGNASRQEMANFYVYINLQASIVASIDQCREALIALDWNQLRETRF
jgi:uncharacterized membrane protein YgaE (UPF0421/DUF939 family)